MKNKNTSKLNALLLASMVTAAATLQGQAVVYESFSFATNGTQLEGNTGDTGLGAWDNTGVTQVSSTNLSFGDLPTSGLAAQTSTLWGRLGAPITADMSGLLANGGEMWFSIRIAKLDATQVRIGFAIGDSALTTNGLLVDESVGSTEQALGGFLSRNSGTFHSLFWENNSPPSINSLQGTSPTEAVTGGQASDIALNAGNNFSVLIVGHAQWGADDNAIDTLTLYSPDATSLGAPGAVRAISKGTVTQQSFDTLGLATGSSAGGTGYYDEIRIGATYADVVPSPESFLEPGTLIQGR